MATSHRHVLITGASSGIGAALARRLAGSGTRLSLVARDPERLAGVAGECTAAGATVQVRQCDVADGGVMERAMIDCDDVAPIDAVVANAGIGGAASLAGNAGEPVAVARRIIETNLIGVINTVGPLVPRMIERGRGHLVIVSSLAGRLGLPQSPSYCASKAGLRTYADALRRLLAPSRVCVSLVSPGFVDTPMSATLPFAKPLMWSADRAAAAIADVLRTGRGDVEFPWPLAMLARLLGVLPQAAADPLVCALGPTRPRSVP